MTGSFNKFFEQFKKWMELTLRSGRQGVGKARVTSGGLEDLP